MNYQRLLLDHLDLINQIARMTGRRRHLSAAEREDFAGFVRLRLIEDDYAILRKFQNRSTLWTYLTMVIERLSLDFCVDKWGRWRPSAMAERLGPVAVTFERLVWRDNHTVDEAMAILRTNPEVGLTHTELQAMWDQLPPARVRPTEVGEELASSVTSDDSAETGVDESDHRTNIDRLQRALQTAFEQIPAQDRVLIALRFDQDLSVVEISKVTGISTPTIHRRLDKAMKRLRLALSEFDRREVANLIGHHSIALSPLLRAEVESFLKSVRLSK